METGEENKVRIFDRISRMWYSTTAKGVATMKKSGSIVAVIALCAGLLAGCRSSTADDFMNLIAPTDTPAPGSDITFVGATPEPEAQPMLITAREMEGLFCPFWAEKDGDRTVAELTQLSLSAREGKVAPASVTTRANEDGSTTVKIRLKEGMVFSDETPVTSNDLLFTYYVLLDSDYYGPSQLKTLPIRGLSDYWNGMDMDMYMKYMTLYGQTYNDGRYDEDLQKALADAEQDARDRMIMEEYIQYDPAVKAAQDALDAYDQEKKEEIRAALEDVWRQDAQKLVDYTMANYSGSITLRTSYTSEEVADNPGLQVMYTMLDRGLGSINDDGGFTAGDLSWDLRTAFPTVEDLYSVMHATYNGDLTQYWKIEGVGRPDILEGVQNELVFRWAPSDEYWRGAVESISGLEITDSLTLEITMEYCDSAMLHTLTDIYIVPLHFYGDRELFRVEDNCFGFTRGDLSAVQAHSKEAFGAGEFIYRSTEIRTVYLDPNPFYWLGETTTSWAEITRE